VSQRYATCSLSVLQITSSGSAPCALQTSKGGHGMARAGPLAAAAPQSIPAIVDEQPEQDYNDDSTVAPVPRWLVTTLNCVMLGGVAATVSVALLSMRRSSSFGSKSQAHTDAMADILARAGKRRGWTATRTERVLHLIGVQRSTVQVQKAVVPGLGQQAQRAVHGNHAEPMLDTQDVKPVTRQGLLPTIPVMQPQHGGHIRHTNLTGSWQQQPCPVPQRRATFAVTRFHAEMLDSTPVEARKGCVAFLLKFSSQVDGSPDECGTLHLWVARQACDCGTNLKAATHSTMCPSPHAGVMDNSGSDLLPAVRLPLVRCPWPKLHPLATSLPVVMLRLSMSSQFRMKTTSQHHRLP
jgi:hypothetical protein